MVDAAKSVGHAFGIGVEDETSVAPARSRPSRGTPFSSLTSPVAGERPSLLGKAAGGTKVEGQVNIKIDGLPEDETSVAPARSRPSRGTPFSSLTSPVAGERPSLLGKAAGGTKVEGQVNIKIDGLPAGSRVEQVRGGTMPINVDAGYSTHALLMP
ncbi:hypothetical protein [Xanthomonas sp. MUS 060]|uniref:hypothetical protein n=1 Tax=Xanthomonas sp. MUS 060 TaxID=1588031 RepID=UPI0005F2C3FE|nr:hypothetical protein [Xanthomonas sp. MUS 060]